MLCPIQLATRSARSPSFSHCVSHDDRRFWNSLGQGTRPAASMIFRNGLSRLLLLAVNRGAVYHNLWDFWTRVLAAWFATGHYHAETTAGMLIIVGDMVSEP